MTSHGVRSSVNEIAAMVSSVSTCNSDATTSSFF